MDYSLNWKLSKISFHESKKDGYIKHIGLLFTGTNRIIYGVGNFEPSNSIRFSIFSWKQGKI